jgi:hypothetical protein
MFSIRCSSVDAGFSALYIPVKTETPSTVISCNCTPGEFIVANITSEGSSTVMVLLMENDLPGNTLSDSLRLSWMCTPSAIAFLLLSINVRSLEKDVSEFPLQNADPFPRRTSTMLLGTSTS